MSFYLKVITYTHIRHCDIFIFPEKNKLFSKTKTFPDFPGFPG